MTSWWEPADTVQGNLLSDDPYAYVAGNPETLSDPTGQLIVASCYSQGCGIYAIPHLSTSLESLTSFPGLSIGSTGTSNGVAGTNHTSSQTSDSSGPACAIGCRSNIFVDNGSHLVPVTSASTAPGCVSVGGFGSLACVSTGGVGGTSFIRVNLPPSTFNYCPPPVGCGGDGNPSDGENTSTKDNIAFANESLGNGEADAEPQNISTEGPQAAAGQPSEPPAGWQKMDYGSDNKEGISDFTHIDENGKKLEVTFYHDSGELQISWMDSLSQARNHLPDLVDWLGDSVQTIKGYPSDNLATYFSSESRGLALVNRMLSSTLEQYGFGPGTIESEGNKMWIVFMRRG